MEAFVSTGIHLTTGTEIEKGLLHYQNKYLKSHVVVAIEGILLKAAMAQKFTVEDKVTVS
eukprot:11057437-Ditylum_brightwellii.AAC.1